MNSIQDTYLEKKFAGNKWSRKEPTYSQSSFLDDLFPPSGDGDNSPAPVSACRELTYDRSDSPRGPNDSGKNPVTVGIIIEDREEQLPIEPKKEWERGRNEDALIYEM
jgi:hypothetical protein